MAINAHVFADPDDTSTDPRRDWSQLVVPPAMLVAASAMGMASHLHLGLSAEVAMAISVAMFCLMLMCHVLLRAADAADRAEEEEAERGSQLVDSPMPQTGPPLRTATQSITYPSAADLGPGSRLRNDAPAGIPEAPPLLETPQLAAHASTSDTTFTGAAPALADSAAWDFRPVDIRKPASGQDGAGANGAPGAEPLGAVVPPLPLGDVRPSFEAYAGMPSVAAMPVGRTEAQREAERIDNILKRLAAQIHSGTAARTDLEPAAEAAGPDGPVLPPPLPGQSLEALAATEPETALSNAVDALRSTVEAMRGAIETTPLHRGEPATGSMPIASPAEVRIAAVAEALAAERAEVFLSPILGLRDDQARHFEVSVQLRGAGGDVIDPDMVAEGAGLLPLLDALNVRHAVGFAMKLERRGRDGAVFSRIAGVSLQSETFVADVAGRHAQGIADRLVLSFAQDEMRGLGPAQLQALGNLAQLGFRFSLQGVADLDMDFEALRALGFDFVKLDAAVFLGGLTCNGMHVPASDICRYFEHLGLAVIVSGIADGATREQMVGCGVMYGQGTLFGAPRPVPVVGVNGNIAA